MELVPSLALQSMNLVKLFKARFDRYGHFTVKDTDYIKLLVLLVFQEGIVLAVGLVSSLMNWMLLAEVSLSSGSPDTSWAYIV